MLTIALCFFFFFFSSRRRHTRLQGDWSSDVCSSDLKLTLFADGHDIPPDIQADLARRNIPVVDVRIIEIAHYERHITTDHLDTRRNIAFDILFAPPRNKAPARLHEPQGFASGDSLVGLPL